MAYEYENLARRFAQAISAMAEDEDALNNFECYLSHHFKAWLEKFANTPEGITEEFETFASMYRDEEEERKYFDDYSMEEIKTLLEEHDELRREFENWLVEDAHDHIWQGLRNAPVPIDWEIDCGRETVRITCNHNNIGFSDYYKVIRWLKSLDEEYAVLYPATWEERESKLNRYLDALCANYGYMKAEDEQYMQTYIEETIDAVLEDVSGYLATEFEDATDIDTIVDAVYYNGWLKDYYMEDGNIYEVTKDRLVA